MDPDGESNKLNYNAEIFQKYRWNGGGWHLVEIFNCNSIFGIQGIKQTIWKGDIVELYNTVISLKRLTALLN